MPDAVSLLQQVKSFEPDILLHLGDVYYSGTQDEMQARFLDVCASVFGVAIPRCFSLSGNHDMYSGGAGYYWLVDRLGQGASYFAAQNDDWLFIAMDTGLHDTDPKQLGSAATFVDPREAAWVNDLTNGSQNQKIVLFSHHPLFTAFDPISGAAVNTLLLEQIRPSLPKLTVWFWGHEHRLAVYDPFLGLARRALHRSQRDPGFCRCLGRSSQARRRPGPSRGRAAPGYGHQWSHFQTWIRDHDTHRQGCRCRILSPGRHRPALAGVVLISFR